MNSKQISLRGFLALCLLAALACLYGYERTRSNRLQTQITTPVREKISLIESEITILEVRLIAAKKDMETYAQTDNQQIEYKCRGCPIEFEHRLKSMQDVESAIATKQEELGSARSELDMLVQNAR